MTTHLPGLDPERGLCGHRHHDRIAASRDTATCSYCRHLSEHGPAQERSGVDRALYEMGNHGGAAYIPAGS